MISDRARRSVDMVLEFGCNKLHIFPYFWDRKSRRLQTASRKHLRMFRIHQNLQYLYVIFLFVRFYMRMGLDNPARSVQIHSLATLVYCLSAICYLQFDWKRNQIMWFTNALLAYVDKQDAPAFKTKDTISSCVVASGILLWINPPAHASNVLETPCVPNLPSSLFFTCETPLENTGAIFSKIPFLILEIYFIGAVFAIWTFNWTMIFLGLAWIQRELESLRSKLCRTNSGKVNTATSGSLNVARVKRYRQAQYIIGALNDSFKLYLEWFPAILLGMITLNLLACIRFWDLPLNEYLLGPACGARCLFEALTPLLLSAKVIRCSAGSLYTFESAIVLVFIDSCVQRTVDLLLMTK